MVQPQRRVHFCGLDERTKASLPDYYKNQYGIDESDCLPFSKVIRADPWEGGLFSARATNFSWEFPLDGLNPGYVAELNDTAPDGVEVVHDEEGRPWVTSTRFNAVYSPEKIQMWLDGQFNYDDVHPMFEGENGTFVDPLWKTATDSYAIINPLDGYSPLEDAVREFGLGHAMYGNFRLYKEGGSFFLDAMFAHEETTIDVDGDPLMLGFSSGGDFFGNRSFFAEGYAQDTQCTNSMRRLTNRLTRRHVSARGRHGLDAKEFDDWWEYLLRKAFDVKSELEEAIEDAQDVTLSLPELPFDLEEFFDLYGFPAQDFAPSARIYAESRAEDRWHPTMWDLHSAVTAVLEHEWDHTEGSQFQSYVRMGNDLLFNPMLSLQQVETEYERRIEEAKGDAEDQGTLEGETGIAQIEEFRSGLAEQAEEWENRQDRLQNMMDPDEEDVEAVIEQ